MRSVHFYPGTFKDYVDWANKNKNIFERINVLIAEATRTPFKGIGKPEPLKGNLKGYWSRRITDEHRLVYKAEEDSIKIVSCQGHYK